MSWSKDCSGPVAHEDIVAIFENGIEARALRRYLSKSESKSTTLKYINRIHCIHLLPTGKWQATTTESSPSLPRTRSLLLNCIFEYEPFLNSRLLFWALGTSFTQIVLSSLKANQLSITSRFNACIIFSMVS